MKLEPERALSVLAKIEQSRCRARGLGWFRESVSESFGGYEGLADIRDACDHSVSPQEADARFQVLGGPLFPHQDEFPQEDEF